MKVVRIKYEENGVEQLSGAMSQAAARQTLQNYANSARFTNLRIVDNGEVEG